MKLRQYCHITALIIVTGLTAMPTTPAYAASDHVLEFRFGGRGRNPVVDTMRNYILGCLPNRTRIEGENPVAATGPWTVRVPAIQGREYSNADVERTLMSQGCARVRPIKVEGVRAWDP